MIEGITVGLTTVQEFERRYGKRDERVHKEPDEWNWYDLTENVLLVADSHYRCSSGDIIDSLEIYWKSPITFVDTPTKSLIRVPKSKEGLLTKLRQGMRRARLAAVLNNRINGNANMIIRSGLVEYSANLSDKGESRYTYWIFAPLFGDQGGLQGFQVGAL